MEMQRKGGHEQKPLKKKQKKMLATLIVHAGIARDTREAREMLAAGEICVNHVTDGEFRWSHGKRKTEDPSILGRIMLDADTQVVHRSKCPECRSKPLVF